MFLIILKITSVERIVCESALSSKEMRCIQVSKFYWCVRVHIVWLTSSLVTDPHIASKFQQLANLHINRPPRTCVPSLFL